MRINKKIYNQIQSEPFDVQELDNGGKIELQDSPLGGLRVLISIPL